MREVGTIAHGSHEGPCWCTCAILHRIPGFCFCFLRKDERDSFLSELRLYRAVLARPTSKQTDSQGFAIPNLLLPPGSKAGCRDEVIPTSPVVERAGNQAGPVERAPPKLMPPTPDLRGPQALHQRSSDAEYAAALAASEAENAAGGPKSPSPTKSSPGPREQLASRRAREGRASVNKSLFQSEGGGSLREKRKSEPMPWHTWRCDQCKRKLPNGHMNCPGKTLKEFDMRSKYGPAIGLTRTERWERAHRLGLNPPTHIMEILNRIGGRDINLCLWDNP